MANDIRDIDRIVSEVLAKYPEADEDEIRAEIREYEAAGRELFVERFDGPCIEVGHGCAGTYWSDWSPYEIVDVISDKTIEVRPLIASRNFAKWPDQAHIFFRFEEGSTKRFRKTKRNGWYRNGERLSIAGASHYRDPSF